jgi:hypothetical protein
LTENVKKLSNNDLIMLNSTESNMGSSNNNSSSTKNGNGTDLTVDISVSPVLSQSQPDYLSYDPITITENAATSSTVSALAASSQAAKHIEVNSINLIPLVPAKVVRNNKTADLEMSSNISSSKQQIESSSQRDEKKPDHLSTFDIMKNAFSNLQAPSYVATFDINKSNTLSEQNSIKPSHSSLVGNAQKSSAKSPMKSSVPQTPMEKLISMGFADRQLNKRLLEKYNDDIEKVIQTICDRFDINDWSLNR